MLKFFLRRAAPAAVLVTLLTVPPAHGQSLTPDPTFGTGGKAYTTFGQSADCRRIALQPDQKIVAAGFLAAYTDWVLTRYLPSGQPDPTFGTGGKLIYDFGFSYEQCEAVAVQPDGKILAGGQADGSFALARLLPSGQPDPAFNGTGRVAVSFGAGNGSSINRILVQPDGKIVVTGFAYNGTDFDFAAARVLPTGALDPSFGTGGRVTVPIGTGRDQGRDALLQPDGKIVIVGETYDAQGQARVGLCRLLPSGAPDAGFGTGGKIIGAFGTREYRATAVARQSNGALVIAGYETDDFFVARYTAAGTLDNTFNGTGYALTDFGNFYDRAYAVLIQPNGKILVGGSGYAASVGNQLHFAVARYTTTGTLDATFGTGGKLSVQMGGPLVSEIYDMTFQADGKPVLAGASQTTQNVNDFALLRLTSAGTNGLAPETDIHAQAVFPNPLDPGSLLTYTLDHPGPVGAVAYDALGRAVAELRPAAWQERGTHTLPLAALAAQPAGLYTVRLTTATGTTAARVVR